MTECIQGSVLKDAQTPGGWEVGRQCLIHERQDEEIGFSERVMIKLGLEG